jgi:hypothetical protein
LATFYFRSPAARIILYKITWTLAHQSRLCRSWRSNQMRRRHISGPAQQAVVAIGRAFFCLVVRFNLVTGSVNPSEKFKWDKKNFASTNNYNLFVIFCGYILNICKNNTFRIGNIE